MNRITYIFIAILLSCTISYAQDNQVKIGNITVEEEEIVITDEYLDSVDFKKKTVINDYTMIGVHYGMALNQMNWNPSMRQSMQFVPVNFGVTWTRYGKMFGYMPYFGIQAGLFYAREGYSLDEGYEVEGARNAIMDVVELPVLAHCHFDFWKMKLMVNLGFYAGYRLSIHRWGDGFHSDIADSFLPTDRRFDYGIKGGAGFGFVFDPVEIHFNAMYKYGMSSLYKPDYYSEYYYRYAYPSNFIFSVSLHFQITKRIGKTSHELKREARRQFEQRRNPAAAVDIKDEQ
ncbi:MAG: porin family protein [Bacteroidales bacterium]|nr:porin family protein [Bacteroidales bacterium]